MNVLTQGQPNSLLTGAGRILVVEDDEELSRLTQATFRKAGFEVDAVSSGEQAVETVVLHPYDIVVLDLELPGIDGHETSRLISEIADVFILMLSDHDSETDRVMALSTTADDYMSNQHHNLNWWRVLRRS